VVAVVLTDVELLLADKHCRDVVLAAAQAVDSQDYDAFVALFTVGASVVRPGGHALVGRAEILASYQAKSPSRLTQHVLCNHRVDVQTSDSAVSRCTVLLYVSDTGRPLVPQGRKADAAHQVGHIEDQMVRTPEGWKIQQRKAWFEFQVAASPSTP
jgi:3-phenylpropionate/cinnamic acid dioxygenase small subunit